VRTPRPCSVVLGLLTAALTVVLVVAGPATAGASSLLTPPVAIQTAPDAPSGHRGQVSCDPQAKPGAAALRSIVMAYYGAGRDGGITRACNINARSEHQEGRAWDWMLNVNNPAEKAVADDFTLWLTGPDGTGEAAGNARRLGVMYVIWNRQIWSASNAAAGWRPYSGASPHIDHVHVSLSWDGAYQRTSWWTGTAVVQPDYGPCQVYVGEWAASYSAPRYEPCAAPRPRPANYGVSASQDLDGDGRPDTVGRERAAGRLWFYAGDGRGGAVSRRAVGTGWQMHDSLVMTGDVTGDGRPDLYGRDVAGGRMYLYPGDGAGSFAAPTVVGSGWHMHDALMSAGDVTGDGYPDLWAREQGTGRLYLYPGSAGGVLTAPRLIGTGWNMHDALSSPGDIDGDGDADLWARQAGTGVLWFYSGDGVGGFASRASVGTGWSMHDVLTPTADVTGDGRPDLFGRARTTGDRYAYPTRDGGVPGAPRMVGTGWNMHDVVL
jgi:hypothetical protein